MNVARHLPRLSTRVPRISTDHQRVRNKYKPIRVHILHRLARTYGTVGYRAIAGYRRSAMSRMVGRIFYVQLTQGLLCERALEVRERQGVYQRRALGRYPTGAGGRRHFESKPKAYSTREHCQTIRNSFAVRRDGVLHHIHLLNHCFATFV